MPAMPSARCAVTAPSRSRTRRYAREERRRKIAVATLMSGKTASVASASRQSRKKRMIAEPKSMSVFWKRLVTPSVTSWSSASTSFVRREMTVPARFRS